MTEYDIEKGFQGLVTLVLFIIVLGPIYSFFLYRIRKNILKRIDKLMSINVSQDQIINKRQLKEIPATSKIQFNKLNVDSHLLEASSNRSKAVYKIRKTYHKRLLLEFVFLFLYFLIIYDFTTYVYDIYYELSLEYQTIQNRALIEKDLNSLSELAIMNWPLLNYTEWIYNFASLFLLTIKILIGWLALSFIGSYYRFSAYKNKFSNAIKPLWNVIAYLIVAKWRFPLYFVLVIMGFLLSTLTLIHSHDLDGGGYLFNRTLLFIAIFTVHLITYRLITIRSRKQSNIKLLILRVFGMYKVSQNIFTKLATYWQLFGSYFTIVDKSFYQVYWKQKYNSNIGVFVFFTLTMFSVFGMLGSKIDQRTNSSISAIFALLAVFSLIFPIIYIGRYNKRKIKRDIINSSNNLDERLEKLIVRPKNIDHSFKEVPLLCYNDTWKMAVDKLSKTVNIILMDLRGFSETNAGCEYEVNFLFDHVHIDKIIFITDSNSVATIEALLIAQWEVLIETSPNLNLNNPKLNIYVTENLKDRNIETQGILDAILYYGIKNERIKKIN